MLEKIALQKKIISEEDCIKATKACITSKSYEAALKEYFISNNLISPGKIDQLIKTIASIKIIKTTMRFGNVAVKLGFISQKILGQALQIQKNAMTKNEKPKLIGQILLDSGKLTNKQIGIIMGKQKKITQKVSSTKEKKPEIKRKKKSEIDELEKPKKIMKGLSEKIQGGMVLEVDDDGMAAFLQKTKEFNDTFSADDILSILALQGIHYGFVEESAIEGFINSSGFYENRFKVASGTPRIQGKNARIEYYFDTDHLKAGGMDEEGTIDFKDRGEIPKVEEKTLLAEKFLLKESRSGRDVYGNEILTEPVIDKYLKCKVGAVISQDETQIFAEISGHPKLSWSGNVSVVDIFDVDGDVGYKTGHLKYEGNIEVQGCLKSGFQVEGSDVKIKEIDGGEIHAEGDVTILDGVNDAKIYSRGHVKAKFIHNSTISCLGNVYIEKEITDSIIESSGSCQVLSGNIINSKIFSNQGVRAKNVGTNKTNPNIIIVGGDIFIKNELMRLERNIIDAEKEMMRVEKKNENFLLDNQSNHQTATSIANELDRALEGKKYIESQIEILEQEDNNKNELKSLKSELLKQTKLFERLDQDLNDRFNVIVTNELQIEKNKQVIMDFEDLIEDYNQEKLNFVDWSESNVGTPEVMASGTICSGTIIKGKHSEKEIKDFIRNVHVKECKIQLGTGDSNLFEIQIHENFK